MPEIKQDIRKATIIVAANDSLHKNMADYVCDGVDDHVEIQAALDALPATGGEVFLLDGTYNVEVALALDSYQTLRGCGRNTILTTTTANLDIITATGGAGTEKVEILIADLCVDGNAGGVVNDKGIGWTYVDHSKISNVWALNNGEEGIFLDYCDFNEITGSHVSDNALEGIYVGHSANIIVAANIAEGNLWGIGVCGDYNVVTGNIMQGSTEYGLSIINTNFSTFSGNLIQGNSHGIYISTGDWITITGNVIQGNSLDGINAAGIYDSTISDNVVQLNGDNGIYLIYADWNIITGNSFMDNSQNTTNTKDNLAIERGDNNTIADNLMRVGYETNEPRYGISILNAASDKNRIIDNDLYDSGATGKVYDEGTGTIGLSVVVPFVDGTDPQDSGFLLDADTELARAYLFLPDEVQQVRYLKIYARSVVAEADKMRLEIIVNGGADNEAYTTHQTLAPNTPSTSANFAADDVIYWTLNSAQILALSAGDSIEIKVLHEAAGNGDCATNAYFRTVEIGYF